MHREFTGEGQHVDVSLLDSAVSWLRTSPQDFAFRENINESARILKCPVGAFETADGYIYITLPQDQFKQCSNCGVGILNGLRTSVHH